ncbi:glycoside hydrolase family 18 protein [Bipolaris oryzae ATCC 44560]|uniref:chitinase n=1 Tax=Bipolaris oryzae ATCC 44560 TaxID=930090 RepID=W6YN37_COCMI|nr:glycoside hydrolase family 18 protein [Bipolaris oryzae ATCC 44560]EUC40697.1 glycoside hydrolase family 18 protein [Bipolaris oryzae ATCC 44560]
MVVGSFTRRALLLSLGLRSINFFSVLAQENSSLRTFALQGGVEAAAEDDDYTCSKTKGCKIGCCGALDPTTGKAVCGLGPDFCGEGCISTCDYKSECDPGWGAQWSNASTCPLNVCCSDFGFCGTTSDFCNGVVTPSPQCNTRTADEKLIGYYEGWNMQRPCGTMPPEEIPLGAYTHINFAFALVNPTTFRIDAMDAETAKMYKRVTKLKERQPGLQVWIAIGGWAMNDPGPYRTTFSDLAKSTSAQASFFESLVTFMKANNFDGVDIDWEYPVAEDRGGIPEDFENYVTFLKNLRNHLNGSGRYYGLTLTLPASYWYMKGFDIIKLEPWVDWFNIMTYDIHGVWDSTVKSIGPYAFAHTNLTEIQLGLELLWRNNINPARVVMGLGFYGRTFTMKDSNCMSAGCEFTEGAKGGECTGTPGVLSAAEINKIIENGATVSHDLEAAAKIVTWDGNQWASFDDAETLKIKLDYANQRCLGGTMIWAIDLDDGSLLEALTSVSTKKKEEVLAESDFDMPDFGTNWDFVPKEANGKRKRDEL